MNSKIEKELVLFNILIGFDFFMLHGKRSENNELTDNSMIEKQANAMNLIPYSNSA